MNTSKKQEGYVVVVVVAALLAALTGFLALAVDIGVLYSARTSAQEVADAAALAGAFTFSPYYPDSPQPQTASNHALQVALNNSVLGQPITAADVNVNVNVASRRVTVDVHSTQNTYFARALGLQTEDIAVEGVAEAAEFSTGTSCAKPWFIPNTVLSSSDPCIACAANEVVISGGEVTAFARSKIGQQFSIKPQDPHTAIRPGDFYAIDLPGSSGGSDYRENIATCINTYVRCGDSYSVKTGNMVGPTKQGVEDLIGNPPTDTWVSVGQYQTPYGLSDTSRNVVVAPIWDTCGMAGFCPDGKFPAGSTVTVQVIGFAAVFLEDVKGSDVVARIISISSCDTSGGGGGGAGGGGTSETGGTVLSVPLRLVRTQ
jgi:Putative Flp pilus-assembly TadE/G-like